ncbi:NADH:flavin oxidoreductase/NADH oxidase [Bosea sp. (in: a-proteobacteria)]|uniref:NADH:flavin oxidoreductase/NADH oxidase n=1 Tax=Bosea sp. (in: a-proteobacteria) TaxID=1871050 RepID=UPI0026381D03|nr:NADH:flavin oxidoreductase/NADH oxidase [Bosea sp. (in: a-proteobacteria)]MCO5092794.1 NADH:flavin oxidoreductase/NADH oxidase [Bosea sp. (in: a-proteobacteria)]
MSQLFSPYQLGSLSLANRIVIAPMCQYSAENGCANDWHSIHLGHLALSGAGLMIVEATAVEPDGRISPFDLGLWNDETEAALAQALRPARRWSQMPIAIQLAHAGRKASTAKPWEGGGQLDPDKGGWTVHAPSAVGFENYPRLPRALTRDDIGRLCEAFAGSARRAVRLGFDAIELHGAHGYLMHQFLSPLSNKREDDYGGSLENRMRFPLEVLDAIRAVVPAGYPVGFRISGTDWVEGGWDIEQSIVFVKAGQARGAAFVDVSGGGISTAQKIPLGPSYQVPLARAVKQATGLPTMAVGLITEPEQAEAIIGTGEADFVALARGILYDPRWPWHAAAALGATVKAPSQYLRSPPRQHSKLFA